MGVAQFKFPKHNLDITKPIPTPKKQTLEAWFKDIRKIIPQVPNPKDTDWQIQHQEATLTHITYELQNSIGERCVIVVDRKRSAFTVS